MSKIAQNLKEKIRTGDVLISENIDFSCLLLSEPVMRGLKNSGFEQPSPIQLKAIPLGRCGLDLIVQAKSGTGKTCVFSVIALESINTDTGSTQVLVLAPTREIAVQIWEVVNSIGSAIKGLQCHTFIGGLPIQEDRVKLKKCHIAVGSPGRIKQLIESGVLKTDSIRLFVLDEADKLLEDSFQEQINWIYSTLPENKQILALSATYPEYLADHLTAYMRNPTFLRLNISDPALLGIAQYYHTVPHHPMSHVVFEEKTKVLINILSNVSFQQCLVFSNLQTRAQNLADVLSNLGWPTACIAGCLDQKDRNHAMAKLKTYKCRILISTDLTSRGIDADKVNMVINMDVPKDHETYLHRIGRAGRFGSFGIAVTLLSDGQERQYLDLVEKRCNTHILPLPDPLPADLAKPNAPPVFLDDVVSSEVILTEEKMVKFRSDTDLINSAEPRIDSKNLLDSALVNGNSLRKIDITETQNGSSFPYALVSANKLEIGTSSTCNRMENVNCVQTFLCQYDVQSCQENGNCHSTEPPSNIVSTSDFNSNLEKMTKSIEEPKEDDYKKICHEQHKDDKLFGTLGNSTVEHKTADISVMDSMMKHEANCEMGNVESVSWNVDDSSTSCLTMKKQSVDQYRDSLLDAFVQMTQEKSENVRVQENDSLPGRIIESLELEKQLKHLNFRDMFSHNTDLKILTKSNAFKENHSIPNTMIENVIGEYCSEPKVLTEHKDTDMLRKAVSQLLELLENRMIPMFENRASSNGNVHMFENRESSNGNVPMFDNREGFNGNAGVKEDELNVTVDKESENSLKMFKISTSSKKTFDNTGMINEMDNTYKAQIVPMVQSSYPINREKVVDFNEGKIDDQNSFLKSCENSRQDASNLCKVKLQKMRKKRMGYQRNFAIGHLLEEVQSKSEFVDATSVHSDKEVSKSVAAFQADNFVSDTIPVSGNDVVNKTDSPVHFKSIVNGQYFGNSLPSSQHHSKSTDDCKSVLQNNLLNIDKPIGIDVLSLPIAGMGEMTHSKAVVSEDTADSETDSDTSKASTCPVKESISKVKSSKAKRIQNFNGQKLSHGKKECLQSLSDSLRGEINKNKQMSYFGGAVDSDHGNAWELWRKKYDQWRRQTSEMYEQWQRQIADLYGCHSHLQTPDFYLFQNPSCGYNWSAAESNRNVQIPHQHLSSRTNAWAYGPADVFPSHPGFQQGLMYSRNQYVSPDYMNAPQNYYTVPNRSPLIPRQGMASADSMQEAFRLQNGYLKSMSKSKKKPEKSQPGKQFDC